MFPDEPTLNENVKAKEYQELVKKINDLVAFRGLHFSIDDSETCLIVRYLLTD